MTKPQALRYLGSLAGGIAFMAAAVAHILWHRGRKASSIAVLATGLASDSLLLADFLIPNFPLFSKAFHQGSCPDCVALTFDDGPRPPHTENILDALRAGGVKATFFVLGQNARRWPDTVRRIEEEGHLVANHGMDHGILMFASGRAALDQVRGAEAVLKDAGVREPARIFRAPHGWLSPMAHRALVASGYRIAGWTKGVWDTANPGVEKIVSRTDDVLKPGAVLLLHDGWSGPAEDDRSQTAAALPEIIRRTRARGLEFVTLAEMMAREGRG